VFCQLLMADEINRASPRTQSALLQAMQEHARDGGRRHATTCPALFMCWRPRTRSSRKAPIRCRKRSLTASCCRSMSAEKQMLLVTTGTEDTQPAAIMTPAELIQAQQLVRQLPVGDSVVEGILNLVRSGRPEESHLTSVKQHVAWGPGPRAGQALMLGARARALMDGRLSPSLDDVLALAKPVLRHRMATSFAARAEGISLDQIIEQLCQPLA
jgi:MoxR-like ATPase